ncbi:phosphoribulokinase [Ectothiorhodospiraceae bacterium WFHF3C12]|nr:phosphoribulokinase [Ectothiorhodospiraceae bacterium WFHF3C12]
MTQPIAHNEAARCDLRALLGQTRRPIIIGVAGDSGAGKSTYMNGVARLLGDDMVATLSLDGYHKEDRETRRRTGRVPLDPEINDLALAREHVAAIRRGEEVTVPVYDHESGRFGGARDFAPAPVVIVEGLHALYPEFLDLYDFTLFVDSDQAVKWEWKMQRDIHDRGYRESEVRQEMSRRETAYKRWIDFQKTQAEAVIKIHPSDLASLAVQAYKGEVPPECFHIEIVVIPVDGELPALPLNVDLNNMTQSRLMPFMLASVPSTYWGRTVNVIHLDGVLPEHSLVQLEAEIRRLTGMDRRGEAPAQVSNATIRLTQLVVAWPLFGRIAHLLSQQGSA